MKPILFNTEMVRAILDGRKTVTRRLVKFKDGQNPRWSGYVADGPVVYGSHNIPAVKAPLQAGDILYVRETWFKDAGRYMYRANYSNDEKFYRNGQEVTLRWRPSIHMPKEAARIFLRVKDVRAERLQDITVDQVAAEGVDNVVPCDNSEYLCNYCPLEDSAKGVSYYGGSVHMCEGSHCNEALDYWEEEFIGEFAALWDSTIKPADLAEYGWDANPWVWVIRFEKISKEEAMKC